MRRGASLFLLIISCRTALPPAAGQFPALLASNSQQAWEQLIRQRESFGGARGFARIQAGPRSFRATIQIDRSGGFLVNVLSPIGTSMATVEARDGQMSVIRGSERSTRSIDELAGALGLPARGFTASDLSMLLVGLPPGDHLEYEVTSTGLRKASSHSVEVTYEPPVFPPRKVTFRSGAENFELEYLELHRL